MSKSTNLEKHENHILLHQIEDGFRISILQRDTMKYLMLIVVFLSSCLTLKDASSDRKMNEETFRNINGTYVAKSDSVGVLDLASFLKIDNYLTDQRLFSEVDNDDLEITIQVLSSKRIEMIVYRNDTAETTFRIKGSLVNNTFELKPQRRFNCDGPLCLSPCFNRQKTRLYLTLEDKLAIDSESKNTCFLLFVPLFTYHWKFYECTFGRTKKNKQVD